MAISWNVKRQLLFFGFFAAVILLLVGGGIYYLSPAPSCTDGKLNQHEENIDCGGECEPCLGIAENLIIQWTRFFEVSPGHYEIASFIENPNLLLGAPEITYRLRLYDSSNVLIAIREGKTFANPRERFVVFEQDVQTLERRPVRATIEFSDINWKRLERERPQLLVTKKDFTHNPEGRLRAVLENKSIFPVNDILLSAVLFDSNGNAVGASTSRLAGIGGEAQREVFFTWRKVFIPAPSDFEVYIRVNLFGK